MRAYNRRKVKNESNRRKKSALWESMNYVDSPRRNSLTARATIRAQNQKTFLNRIILDSANHWKKENPQHIRNETALLKKEAVIGWEVLNGSKERATKVAVDLLDRKLNNLPPAGETYTWFRNEWARIHKKEIDEERVLRFEKYVEKEHLISNLSMDEKFHQLLETAVDISIGYLGNSSTVEWRNSACWLRAHIVANDEELVRRWSSLILASVKSQPLSIHQPELHQSPQSHAISIPFLNITNNIVPSQVVEDKNNRALEATVDVMMNLASYPSSIPNSKYSKEAISIYHDAYIHQHHFNIKSCLIKRWIEFSYENYLKKRMNYSSKAYSLATRYGGHQHSPLTLDSCIENEFDRRAFECLVDIETADYRRSEIYNSISSTPSQSSDGHVLLPHEVKYMTEWSSWRRQQLLEKEDGDVFEVFIFKEKVRRWIALCYHQLTMDTTTEDYVNQHELEDIDVNADAAILECKSLNFPELCLDDMTSSPSSTVTNALVHVDSDEAVEVAIEVAADVEADVANAPSCLSVSSLAWSNSCSRFSFTQSPAQRSYLSAFLSDPEVKLRLNQCYAQRFELLATRSNLTPIFHSSVSSSSYSAISTKAAELALHAELYFQNLDSLDSNSDSISNSPLSFFQHPCFELYLASWLSMPGSYAKIQHAKVLHLFSLANADPLLIPPLNNFQISSSSPSTSTMVTTSILKRGSRHGLRKRSKKVHFAAKIRHSHFRPLLPAGLPLTHTMGSEPQTCDEWKCSRCSFVNFDLQINLCELCGFVEVTPQSFPHSHVSSRSLSLSPLTEEDEYELLPVFKEGFSTELKMMLFRGVSRKAVLSQKLRLTSQMASSLPPLQIDRSDDDDDDNDDDNGTQLEIPKYNLDRYTSVISFVVNIDKEDETLQREQRKLLSFTDDASTERQTDIHQKRSQLSAMRSFATAWLVHFSPGDDVIRQIYALKTRSLQTRYSI